MKAVIILLLFASLTLAQAPTTSPQVTVEITPIIVLGKDSRSIALRMTNRGEGRLTYPSGGTNRMASGLWTVERDGKHVRPLEEAGRTALNPRNLRSLGPGESVDIVLNIQDAYGMLPAGEYVVRYLYDAAPWREIGATPVRFEWRGILLIE